LLEKGLADCHHAGQRGAQVRILPDLAWEDQAGRSGEDLTIALKYFVKNLFLSSSHNDDAH
jgi:hypothetical protein